MSFSDLTRHAPCTTSGRFLAAERAMGPMTTEVAYLEHQPMTKPPTTTSRRLLNRLELPALLVRAGVVVSTTDALTKLLEAAEETLIGAPLPKVFARFFPVDDGNASNDERWFESLERHTPSSMVVREANSGRLFCLTRTLDDADDACVYLIVPLASGANSTEPTSITGSTTQSANAFSGVRQSQNQTTGHAPGRELMPQERLAVLGEAAAVLAHEVRNPLAAILNATSVLKRESTHVQTREMMVLLVEEEALRLERLVRDLLDLARPLDPRPTPVELPSFTERILDSIAPDLEDTSIRVEVEAEGSPPPVYADPTLLTLAVENLVRNAIQASPPGGLVRVSIAKTPGGTVLAVEDDGRGVPVEHRERIFEPFFTTRATGTGLGLAVVKRVAEAHGLRLEVGSSPSGGARFGLRWLASPGNPE